ncbi:hypothetical protein C7271_04210 [filamentous cyanobacterium CCP5]|nr:hypothetical protein C7271_04210 [filamentous cyanobacterium CCP5]
MLPTAITNSVFNLDQDFLETTTPLDLLSSISSLAETVLLAAVDELETATGILTVTTGGVDGTLTTGDGDLFSGGLDVPSLLSEVGATLANSTGSFSLAGGILNGAVTLDGVLYGLDNFDLARFAGNGFEFLLNAAEASIPLQNGAFLISAETGLGPLLGEIDIAGGDLDIAFDTPAGDFDVSLDFTPDDVFTFALPTALGNIDAIVNLDAGTVEIPVLLGSTLDIPLSDLSGSLALDGGMATLNIDTQFGPISTNFDVNDLVNSLVVDPLTGLTVEATLDQGQLNLVSTRGTETFEMSADLVALNQQLVDAALQTNGSLSVEDGLFSGSLSVGPSLFAVDGTFADIEQFLSTSLGELLAPAATAV